MAAAKSVRPVSGGRASRGERPPVASGAAFRDKQLFADSAGPGEKSSARPGARVLPQIHQQVGHLIGGEGVDRESSSGRAPASFRGSDSTSAARARWGRQRLPSGHRLDARAKRGPMPWHSAQRLARKTRAPAGRRQAAQNIEPQRNRRNKSAACCSLSWGLATPLFFHGGPHERSMVPQQAART